VTLNFCVVLKGIGRNSSDSRGLYLFIVSSLDSKIVST